MELKTYYITFDPDEFESGIDMIAITEDPAIESYALRFRKEEQAQRFSINQEKHLIIGPAMIPDKLIYRKEGDHEFNVVFTQEVIDQMLEKFKSEQRAIQFNFEHDEDRTVSGFVKEAWIVEDSEKDKSALYGFNLPVGTLMISAKIQDIDAWESVIKNMENVGFSVEGLMGIKQFAKILPTVLETETKQNKNEKMKKNKKRVFATRFVSSKKKFNITTRKYEDVEITEEKEVLIVEDLEVDSEVEILTEEGTIETAPDGEYIIEDEAVEITVEDGVITEAEEIEIETEPEAEFAEEDEEIEEEVEVEEMEEVPAEVNAETIAKLVELETRLDAIEAAMAADAEEAEEFKKFAKDKSKAKRLALLRTLTK